MRRLGGTDIGKLLGVSSYGGPREVYDRCVDGVEKPAKPAQQKRQFRGHFMEPVLRDIAGERFGFEIEPHSGVVVPPGTLNDYYEHPDNDFAHAQIDSLAIWKGRRVVIDYKTMNIWAQKYWGPDGSDKVPESIHAQVAWGMSCTDRDLSVLVVGFGLDVDGPEVFDLHHVVTYFVEREPIFESYCLAVAREFWEAHALPRVRPTSKTGGKKKRAAA